DGIVLQNTTGSFTVTGDGSTAGSGGEIQHMTGADGAVAGSGVYLSNVAGVSLNWMHLHDFDNFAIHGSSVTGFTLTHSTIDGANGNTSREDSINFSNLLGSATIDHSSISGGWADNLRVINSTGTLDRLTVTNTTFGAINPSAAN